MAAHKPKKIVVENNSAVIGKFPVVRFVDPADEKKYQCRWVRTTMATANGGWSGNEYEADSNGYIPVSPAEVGLQRYGANEGSVVRFAEYILMKCDRGEYDARQKDVVDHSIALQAQIDKDIPQLSGGSRHVVPMATQ